MEDINRSPRIRRALAKLDKDLSSALDSGLGQSDVLNVWEKIRRSRADSAVARLDKLVLSEPTRLQRFCAKMRLAFSNSW